MKRIALALLGLAILTFVVWPKADRNLTPTPTPVVTLAKESAKTAAIARPVNRARLSSHAVPNPVWPAFSFQTGGRTLSDADIHERGAFNDQLLQQTPSALFELWLAEADRKNDPLKLEFISNALVFRLRKAELQPEHVLARVEDYILDAQRDAFLRWHLVEALGETATPGALEILLRLAKSPDELGLKPIVMRQIARIGDQRWEGCFHDELSPLIEKAWRDPATDPTMQASLSMALAKVGAASGVQMLLAEVRAAGPDLKDFEERGDHKAWAAYDALDKIRNPGCVQLLDQVLKGSQPGGIDCAAAGHALAAMGHPAATQSCLQWVQAQVIDVGFFVDGWLSIMRDRTFVRLAESVLKNGAFADPRNRSALERVLREWHAHRPSE